MVQQNNALFVTMMTFMVLFQVAFLTLWPAVRTSCSSGVYGTCFPAMIWTTGGSEGILGSISPRSMGRNQANHNPARNSAMDDTYFWICDK